MHRVQKRRMTAIEQFNRQCAQERAKLKSDHGRRGPKKVNNILYDPQNLIGRGTFSSVYRGTDTIKCRQVAIKVTQLKTIQRKGIDDLFKQQLHIIQQLRHPNIVTCYQYFRTNNNCYTVYQYCQGGDLASIITKGGFKFKEDLKKVNVIIKDVFQGLLYLENMKIVHRDIKAANVLMNRGRAKIGDFGFATRCKSQFKDASIGSPAYMSPQGLLRNIYGPKTDVWAFGMLLYELMHGVSPFDRCESEQELKKAIEVPINWDQLKSTLPSQLKRLILKCLRVNVEERPTFSDLLTDEYIQKLYHSSPQKGLQKQILMSKSTVDSETICKSLSLSQLPIKFDFTNMQNADLEKQFQGQIKMCKALSIGKQFEHLRVDNIQKTPSQSENEEITELQPSVQLPRQYKLTKRTLQQSELIFEKVISLLESPQLLDVLELFYLVLVTFQTKNEPIDNFSVFVNRLSQEAYVSLKEKHEQQAQRLIDSYEKTSLTVAQENKQKTDPQELLKSAVSNVFILIKAQQKLIDKQDNTSSRSTKEQNALVFIGNQLLLSYKILLSLKRSQRIADILLAFHSKDTNSSQQFYIWLYEIELQKMQEQNP